MSIQHIRIYTSRGWLKSGNIEGDELVSAFFTQEYEDAAVFSTDEAARRYARRLQHLKARMLAKVPL